MRHEFLDNGAAAARRSNSAVAYINGPKRRFDVFGALVLSLLALPLVLVLALCSWARGRTAFFAHERIGRHGVPFACWKLRTMRPNAQDHLRRHLRRNPAAAREWAQFYKLRDDPRVTWLGRFLRRTSLDELPQLWNVLRGDMSLVGPRPITVDELPEYGNSSWAYLMVRPGITGLWQVSGRNDVTYAERVRLDTRYVARMTMRRDLAILWRTVGVVLRRTGQ